MPWFRPVMPSDCESESGDGKTAVVPRRSKVRALGKTALVVAGAGLVLLLLMRGEMAERSALRQMSEGERRALFLRTLENVRSVCARAEDAMRGFCTEQARFLLEFPECDRLCQDLASGCLSRVQVPR
jgi:hypothetical protein